MAEEKPPKGWHRTCRKVLRRCEGRCEHRRAHFDVRCPRPATVVVHVGKADDHSLDNLRGLCEWHAAQKAAADLEAGRWLAIPVRPAKPEDGG